jgi:hypothetical protein
MKQDMPICLSVCLSIYLSVRPSARPPFRPSSRPPVCPYVHPSMAFLPLWTLCRFFSFLILYAVHRTSWTGDQPVARSLPTHKTAQMQNKRTQRHPCLQWDSNPRSQCSSGRRRSIDRAATMIGRKQYVHT